jgi:hypothetical protein
VARTLEEERTELVDEGVELSDGVVEDCSAQEVGWSGGVMAMVGRFRWFSTGRVFVSSS